MHNEPAPHTAPKSVMIITGDASGDLHGSRLVKAMRKKDGPLFFFGIGGHALRAAGVKILVDTSSLSVIGVTEIFSKLPTFLSAMMLAKTLLKKFQPDLLILIDFPGFNLPVSAIAKRYRVPVLYYISPQIWAWSRGRVKKIRKRVDHMAVILPFEAEFYRNHQVPVTFVGHPLMDAYDGIDKERSASGKDNRLIIGLLPGSRRRERTHLFPVMLKAATMVSERLEDVRFAISQAASVDRTAMAALIQKHAPDIDYELVPDGADKVFNKCALSVVTSGTVTLEAAICGVPMVIIYKVAPITALLCWFLLRVDHIGLVNLIAGKRLVPELMQFDASPKKITDAVCNMIGDSRGLEAMRQELSRVKDALGSPGASERTAEIALNML